MLRAPISPHFWFDGRARRSPQEPGAAVERTAGPPRAQRSVYPQDGQPLVRPLRSVCSPQGHVADEEMLVAHETRW
ncbi:MAG TPA: hypothetical protein VE817_06290 [Candidatus Acidoferrum sp.]|nr:hypothetical protein [Candidatus Acidoferrum sp.]